VERVVRAPRGHRMALSVVGVQLRLAGQQVVLPPQRCPTYLQQLVRWGGYWRWLRAPLLVERIWVR
jgi:hypothetical protein